MHFSIETVPFNTSGATCFSSVLAGAHGGWCSHKQTPLEALRSDPGNPRVGTLGHGAANHCSADSTAAMRSRRLRQRNSQELKRSFMSSPLSDHHTQSLRSASFVFSGELGMWLAIGTPVERWWETSPSAE